MNEEASTVPLPRYLQLMWDLEPSGRRGPKPGRTIWEIGTAAVATADADGLDAVSMKSVSAALGMTSMSLYRYVDSKEDLLAVMLDIAYGPVPDLAGRDTWRDRLTAWAYAAAAQLVAHPWIVRAMPRVPPTTPNVLGWTDAGVAAFAGLPLDGQEKMSALLVLDGYLRSHVQQAISLGLVGPTAASARGSDGAEVDDEYARRLAVLVDPERLPSLAAAAREAFGEDDDDDFYQTELAFGIGVVLDGIAALAAVPPGQRARPSLLAGPGRPAPESR